MRAFPDSSWNDRSRAPMPADRAWLRLKVLRHVVVDLRLLEAMGRVIPLTLLPQPTVPGYGARDVRRTAQAALKPRRPSQARLYVPGNAA